MLDAKATKATFFFQGQFAANHPDLVLLTGERGHAVGTHAWTHMHMDQQTPAEACQNAARGQQAIADAGLPAPTMLRPPYGTLTDTIVATCPEFQFVLWNVDTRDWSSKDEAKILEHFEQDTKPGAIILLHETVEANLTAMPKAIDWLRSQGYELVTVPELFGGEPPSGQRIYKGPSP